MSAKRIITIRIRDLRRERALTQEELAEALGISRQSINAMEAGRCLPSLPVALEIASYFAVPLQRLIDLADEEEAAARQLAAPRSEWGNLQSMMHSLLDQSSHQLAEVGVPAVNLSVSEQAVQLALCLPGYTESDLAIEVGDSFVTVAGNPSVDEPDHRVRQEFALYPFSRTVQLPVKVDADSAVAEMKHGILTITLQQQHPEPPRTKRVSISTS
jgi:HSP20 family molecular chaperone IbpA